MFLKDERGHRCGGKRALFGVSFAFDELWGLVPWSLDEHEVRECRCEPGRPPRPSKQRQCRKRENVAKKP